MPRKKLPRIDLYQLADIAVDEISDKHIELVTTPKEYVVDGSMVGCDSNSVAPAFVTKVKSAPYKSVIYHKILFLLHLIITKCRASRDNKIQLNSKYLQDILGSDYSYLLHTFEEMGIIGISNHFIIGEQSRLISLLDWDIKVETSPNMKVIEYLNRWNKLIEKAKSLYSEDVDTRIVFVDGQVQILLNGDSKVTEDEKRFREQYQDSLSMLDLRVTKTNAIAYINSLFVTYNNHRYNYYSYCIKEFDKNKTKIQSIDKQNRIYHCLTSLPKALKPLFNIKYQIDIANSHPLLICYLLIEKYNIGSNILSNIYNIRNNEEGVGGNIHYITDELCKILDNNNISVPLDILLYIYICSIGRLWDFFTEMFDSYTRDEVKTKVFREILYPARDFTEHTAFGKRFIELFPNVYEAIKEQKQHTQLPLYMMRLESKIMRAILTRCYEQGLKVISIHDALIILDVPENNDVNLATIKSYIDGVYSQYLLKPTVHNDEFPLPAIP